MSLAQPKYELVEWAAQTLQLTHPWDRLWVFIKTPDKIQDAGGNLFLTLEYKCFCQKSNITLAHHLCQDSSHLYLGQCARCQKILWTTHP
jgi:hypothetical protein